MPTTPHASRGESSSKLVSSGATHEFFQILNHSALMEEDQIMNTALSVWHIVEEAVQ